MKNPNNIILATYLGAKPNKNGEYEMYGIIDSIVDGVDEKHFFYPDEMLFDEDYNWIMAVVHKIRDEYINWEPLCNVSLYSNINEIYNEVVEAVKIL